jgi:uncharacterized membrane protein YccC
MNGAAENPQIESSRLARFADFLIRELSPYPGRFAIVLRITTASTLAMIIVLAFKIPFAALGIFYILAISHRNLSSTLQDGVNILLANAAGIAVLLLGAVLFADLPLMHFLFAVLCFFSVFFLTRTLKSYSTAFGFSVIIAAAFPMWDLPYPAWLNVGDTLWIGWGISLCTIVTMATEWMFRVLGSHPGEHTSVASGNRERSHPWTLPNVRDFFVEDGFSNPEYIKFALKGCLATTICYLIYSAVAWPGIAVCTATCIITAPLFNSQSPMFFGGTPVQRLAFRLAGSFTGGVIFGMGLQGLILPYVDITGFIAIFIAVSLFATWFATSSPLLSYFGRQTALAFYLTILQGFSVGASLVTSRDRVAGIWLGLFVMWIVFDNLWITQMQEAKAERIV